MSLDLMNVAGTIRVNPLVDSSLVSDNGDATLAALFACLAHQEELQAADGVGQTPCLVTHSRLGGALDCRLGGERSIRADLNQLLVDLQAEYDRLGVAS
jgi:hypothetical protein